MAPPRTLDDISALLRTHVHAEVQTGFPRLKRIPSTGVVKFLDYFYTVPSAESDALLAALAQKAALHFFPPLAIRGRLESLATENPALIRYRQAVQSPRFSMGLRYQGVRMLKSMLADPMSMEMMEQARAALDFVPRDDLPEALVPDSDLARLQPAKAPLLRKLIQQVLPHLIGAEKKKSAGGETEYVGVHQNTPIRVVIDLAAMGIQLRCGVTIPDDTRRTLFWQRTYEDLWASGSGWDLLTEQNAEQSIHLLGEQIVELLALRNRVMGLL